MLIGEDRAIVTPQAGTTRDTIEEHISLNGFCVRLSDTAGVVENLATISRQRSIEEPERLGIQRSWDKIKSADMVLYLIDCAAVEQDIEDFMRRGQLGEIDPGRSATEEYGEEASLQAQIKSSIWMSEQNGSHKDSFRDDLLILDKIKAECPRILLVFTKMDLIKDSRVKFNLELIFADEDKVFISNKLNYGISDLRDRVYSELIESHLGGVYVTNKRHYDALSDAKGDLEGSINILGRLIKAGGGRDTPARSVSGSLDSGKMDALVSRANLHHQARLKEQGTEASIELISVELRSALRRLEEIIGVTGNEDLLGLIFSKFCIGK